ncbi:24180_t:CDS:2 [Gigaspora margarita]|uniref:24180_t:CDS:1 n=1 Tax=Gigaspora margarita TaxID=4874 RepID=A0ABN7UUG3_GIGMA|nr:24180_t:CDS:2 [Gigaspora margarita]
MCFTFPNYPNKIEKQIENLENYTYSKKSGFTYDASRIAK